MVNYFVYYLIFMSKKTKLLLLKPKNINCVVIAVCTLIKTLIILHLNIIEVILPILSPSNFNYQHTICIHLIMVSLFLLKVFLYSNENFLRDSL